MMRCEEKIPGGKLVCLEVWAEGGRVVKVKITGDFFLHPEDTIIRLEKSLEGAGLDSAEADIEKKLREALGGSQLIGATSADLARIFRKAVGA